MKTILSSSRHYYVARVSIFLIVVALITGMVGFGCSPAQYQLTITSTAGGSVTEPGEGTFTYDEGMVVNLTAEAEEGSRFVNWTGDVDTIGSGNWTGVDAPATTTITMLGDYEITANFAISADLEIRDWYDLNAVRDNLDGNHTLMNDLDSTTAGYEELASPTADDGKGWQPIGDTPDNNFSGIFDGQGYEIRDLCINRPDESIVGLFGFIYAYDYQGSTIKNLGVVNATVIGGTYGTGGLVSGSCGTVSGCYFIGNVTGEWYVGGLVGSNEYGSVVTNSYTTGSVTGRLEGGFVGGLVGSNGGDTVGNSYSSAHVSGNRGVGGLVGWNGATVSNSYATGNVSGNEYIGGLVGLNADTVTNSYSTGNVTGYSNVGGLVGGNQEGGDITMSDSFWDTEISGQSTSGGGTGKTTAEMQDITTFTDTGTEGLDEPWDIIAVDTPSTRNLLYIWNIVDDETYPFLSWQPVS